MKIEVGKKYICENDFQLPMTLIADRMLCSHYISGDDVCSRYIFIDDCGDIYFYDKEDITEEYQEPIKSSIEGWVKIYEGQPDKFLTSQLLGKNAGSYLHKNKFGNSVYGRFTFEQLPEPE